MMCWYYDHLLFKHRRPPLACEMRKKNCSQACKIPVVVFNAKKASVRSSGNPPPHGLVVKDSAMCLFTRHITQARNLKFHARSSQSTSAVGGIKSLSEFCVKTGTEVLAREKGEFFFAIPADYFDESRLLQKLTAYNAPLSLKTL